jgi:capsular exopolysaccharide synthesis family protein
VQLRVEEQELLNQYGNDHPQLRAIRRQIETVERIRTQELASIRGGRTGQGIDPDIVSSFLSMMERKVELLVSEEGEIESQIKTIQEKSTSVSALVEKLNALRRERERLEIGYAAIIERMSELNALKEHLWRNLSILDPPSVPEVVAPKLSICLAAGLFLGGLTGLGFAAFKDIAEKTFRSSDDVGELLGTPVIGHINMFEKRRIRKREDFPQLAPELVSLHQPSTPPAEAYRSLRTTIFFNAQKSNAKVIQLTSPIPGDGKSTTISNLAISIAQSGKRVILLDADFRKPVQHKLFGLDNGSGATSVIYGETAWQDAAQVVIPGALSILPAGPIPHNPAELLTSEQFPQLIETLKAEFDYVLIDTPPLLAVTDPAIVSSHADLLYLVMRIRKGARTNAVEAGKIIDSMGGGLAGVVINGLRRQDQKYYNYGGRYGYQYGGYKTYGETPEPPVGKAVGGPNTFKFKPHSKKVGSSSSIG